MGAEATVPRFTDPARRAKLEAAFPRIEKIFEKYQQERRIPGSAVRDRDRRRSRLFQRLRCARAYLAGSGDAGYGLSNRVHDQELHRAQYFEAARRQANCRSKIPCRSGFRSSRGFSIRPGIRRRSGFASSCRTARDSRRTIRGAISQLDADDATLTQWLQQGLPFSTPPDTSYEYSNYGFALLGRIVSKASGVPYAEYLEKNILAPLGMRCHDARGGDLAGECSRDGLPAV